MKYVHNLKIIDSSFKLKRNIHHLPSLKSLTYKTSHFINEFSVTAQTQYCIRLTFYLIPGRWRSISMKDLTKARIYFRSL